MARLVDSTDGSSGRKVNDLAYRHAIDAARQHLARCESHHLPLYPTADDLPVLAGRMVELATRYGRCGYRRITAMLRAEDWHVNHKRVEGSGAGSRCSGS